MTDLSRWIAVDEQALIEPEDREWLEGVFERFAGYPDLKQIWALMDEVWQALGCDPEVMDARIGAYYSHPVWLLNGLFIEQHRESLDNRRMFRDWVVKNAPERVAEFGGGFGSLARMIGEALPSASVDVIEPHPHPLAIARAEKTRNVRYRPEMQGEYDALIATDVFEHVTDPLQLVYETAQHLRQDGRYLIANCFFSGYSLPLAPNVSFSAFMGRFAKGHGVGASRAGGLRPGLHSSRQARSCIGPMG